MAASQYHVVKHYWDDWNAVTDPTSAPSFLCDEALTTYRGSDDQAMYCTMSVLAAGVDDPRMTSNSVLVACLL